MRSETDHIETVLVVGAGTMGQGIAQAAAAAGLCAILTDVSEEVVNRGLCLIREGLDKRISRGKLEAADAAALLARIEVGTDPESLVGRAELVVEAIPEKLDLKRDLFARLDRAAPDWTILATNTSSLPVSEIARATNRPDRVLGAHFFNPVPAMPLLELVRTGETSDDTIEAVRRFGEVLGKTVIVVRDTPGFATSRLGVVLGLEAMRMLEQGVASAEDIDRALELGYRHPMGPLKLTDLVGLDVRLHIAEHLHRELGGDQYRPPEILRQMVAEGKTGKKSGQGFYRWE